MAMEATGKIHALFDTQQVTERFRKREFVIELAEQRYPQFVMFQLTGNRCEDLDGFEVGNEVRVEFNLRGREWQSPQGEMRYFNSLDVWRLERKDDRARPPHDDIPLPDEPPPSADDDIPF